MIPSTGQSTVQKSHDTLDDTAFEVQIDSLGGDGTKSLVVISQVVSRYFTEISARCKTSMYPKTTGLHDECLSTDHLVADLAFAARSKTKAPPKRPAANSSEGSSDARESSEGSSDERNSSDINSIPAGNFCQNFSRSTRRDSETRSMMHVHSLCGLHPRTIISGNLDATCQMMRRDCQ